MSSRGLLVLYLLKGGRRPQGGHPHNNMGKNAFNAFIMAKLIRFLYSPSFDGATLIEVSSAVVLLLLSLYAYYRSFTI